MWQDIATAPKDGSKFDAWMDIPASPLSMGWADSFRVPDVWFQDGEFVHDGGPAALRLEYITHWMPLPPPPVPT